jgi:hypothetical protein
MEITHVSQDHMYVIRYHKLWDCSDAEHETQWLSGTPRCDAASTESVMHRDQVTPVQLLAQGRQEEAQAEGGEGPAMRRMGGSHTRSPIGHTLHIHSSQMQDL